MPWTSSCIPTVLTSPLPKKDQQAYLDTLKEHLDKRSKLFFAESSRTLADHEMNLKANLLDAVRGLYYAGDRQEAP